MSLPARNRSGLCKGCYAANKYRSLKAAGVCVVCRIGMADMGVTRCGGCLADDRVARCRLNRQRAELGMCRRCFRPALEGDRVCAVHRGAERRYESVGLKRRVTRYAERKAVGVCVTCGVNPVGGMAKCDPCAAAWRTYRSRIRDRWVSAGRCEECGGRRAEDHSTRCGVCLDRRKKKPKNNRGGEA